MTQSRHLEADDYDRGHLELLSQLSSAPTTTSRDKYAEFVTNLNENHNVIVFIKDNKTIATATYFIEAKLIHDMGKVGHIEDVVVLESERGTGLGKALIRQLVDICIQKGCYKVILDCDETKKVFYEKCGLAQKGLYMAKYISGL